MRKIIFILLLCLITTSASGQFQQEPMLGLPINKAHQLGDPVAFWPFNEGSGDKVFDLSGNGNTGTVTSGTWVPGKFGSEVDFTAATTKIDCGTNVADFEYTDSFSVVMWLNPDDLANFETWITKQDSAEPYRGWQCGTGPGGDRQLPGMSIINDNDGGIGEIITVHSTSVGLVTTRLQQLVWTYDGSGVAAGFRCYIDGISVALTTIRDALGGNTILNTRPLVIGGRNTVADYDGTVSQVLIYDRALSASEIALLYQEPFCMFEEDLPVTLMYSYAAPPPGGGQLIYINFAAISLFLLSACGLYINRRNQ